MKNKQDHFNVLRGIQKNPETSQRELAEELGFSLGKLNYCIKALQKKGLVLAVVVSSLVGLSVDSALFLWLAFGNLDFIEGQIIGKALMVFAAIPVIYWIRNYELRELNNDSSVAGI